MFYCDNCAKKRSWPAAIFKSYGRCEVCKDLGVCNDVPSTDLPMNPCNEIQISKSEACKIKSFEMEIVDTFMEGHPSIIVVVASEIELIMVRHGFSWQCQLGLCGIAQLLIDHINGTIK